jgi:adenine-specific DNA-methyltransferase
LHRAREIPIFDSIKLITPQLQNYPNFTIDYESNYPDAGGYSLTIKNKNEEDMLYYLGLLNSSTFWFYILNTSTPFNNNYYYFKSAYIEPFCFPDNNDEIAKKQIINAVDSIYNLRKAESSQSESQIIELEKNINISVYKLYGFNQSQIISIEQSNIKGGV